jgi:hypothetical protein
MLAPTAEPRRELNTAADDCVSSKASTASAQHARSLLHHAGAVCLLYTGVAMSLTAS